MTNKFYLLILMILITTTIIHAQWTIYECNQLPSQATPAWYPTGEGPTAGVEDWFSVINDPIMPGNKLLLFEELTVTGKEFYAVDWDANKSTGATVVFRLKASDTLLDLISQNTDSTVFCRWAQFEVRNGWIRDDIRLEYSLRKGFGYGVVFIQSASKEEYKETARDYSFDQTLTDWHIYRITIQDDMVKLYIDEDPTPVLYGKSPTLDRDKNIRIGDKQPTAYMGSVYDWIIWDTSGAYPPKQGTPIPRSLLGWQTDVEEDETALPDNFTLYANFPNPFNPETTIQFDLVKSGNVKLNIYDIKGQTIRTLLDENKQVGSYQVNWDGRDETGQLASSGMYIYEIKFDGIKKSGKMLLLK